MLVFPPITLIFPRLLAPRISAFCLLPFVLVELLYNVPPPSPGIVSKIAPFGKGLANFMVLALPTCFETFPHANAKPVW